ncbi:MAG: nitronate monooxygenase [Weeksellaceae bacterium]|nr:nitronate monooxygenase [Weeksellaceae bacterium]
MDLKQLLGIQHPLIVAPMFLVSNVAMVRAAMEAGCAGCIPALNYRSIEGLEQAIQQLHQYKKQYPHGAFGFNLIVNKANPKTDAQLAAICRHGADFIITSLGNPQQVIEQAHAVGIKVFCDVTDLKFAQKVEKLGADAIIAVNSEAGGHRGNISPKELLESLTAHCQIPVISAGGTATHAQMQEKLSWGAAGVSVGSPFIASAEAEVSEEYKQACVDFGAADIVMTEKISGTPCSVINTPYVQKIGTKTTALEKFLHKNKNLRKYLKMLRYIRGMNQVEKAATQATYKTVWVAGPSIEHTHAIEPMATILQRILDTPSSTV